MWPAPTAEDWKKPVLLTFQRTWKDAVAVSKETNKPILVCINMDGEIASEHYAGIRYRQPDIAKLYEPYVCVIASVYRHNPSDHDDQGRRILCPRFGSVTCGEHIWIEPLMFEKFCDGRRVAPRHIAVDLNGKETYDIYYRNDTASVFNDIRDQVPKSDLQPKTIVRGDRPILERVASRDVRDRKAVEEAYRKGDKAMRKSLLDATLKNKSAEQIDLLRLAIFGLDADASKNARRALAEVETPDAADLLSDSMRVPMDDAERKAMITALKRLGAKSPRARWLAGVHEGLGGASTNVDLKRWLEPRAKGGTERGEYDAGFASDVESHVRASQERPADPAVHLALAEATLALALKAPQVYADNPRLARLVTQQLYKDALESALAAEKNGGKGWRLDAVLALSAYYSGAVDEGYARSAVAVRQLPAGDRGWSSMAVLTIYAESRWKAIKAAVRAGEDWPSEWLTDLNTAYSILLKHPLGTESQVLWHYELLSWLGARYRSVRVLREGLTRFRTSRALHAKLRERVLKFRGPDALEKTYSSMLKEDEEAIGLIPYAAYASVIAAEQHRRSRQFDKAIAAYGRAIGYYERAITADRRYAPTSDRAIALALAGRARVAYQLEDDERALKDILASFARDPSAAGTRDRMGITPGETAQMLLARLRENKKSGDAKKLDDAIGTIQPDLLRPDIGLEEK
ncbi:MAG: tetratricopeptide repeat protein [Planctomycetota bacterium]|jgi:tetratricopeptide (TPR) repeat protein